MTDALEKRLLANEAQEMLGKEGAFAKAAIELRKHLFDRLLSAPVGSPEAAEIHSQLKVLSALAGELQALITDYNFAKQRGQG
jgi:hypothetical protein